MGRWFFRFGEEVVPPRLWDGLRLVTVPPPPFTRFHYLSPPFPPRFTMGGVDVRVRFVDDIDVVGREQTRLGGRDEGRAQERPHAPQGISCWGQPRCLLPGASSVRRRALRLPCGRTLRRRLGPLCLRRGSTADRRGWRFARARPLVNSARPPPEVSGVVRRIFGQIKCGLECL